MPGLEQIEHIVVLMLENRSFDHMLGYLSLNNVLPVDGLTGNESNDDASGAPRRIRHLASHRFRDNPGHSHGDTAQQLAGGFVTNFEAKYRHNEPVDAVMGYYDGADLPVFDFLARNFCVCDRWFASVPGPTIPNRLFAMSGQSGGYTDPPPQTKWGSLKMRTVFEVLDRQTPSVTWNYFNHDTIGGLPLPALIRIFRHHVLTHRVKKISEFYHLCQTGRLPSLSWIDPNFGDINFLDVPGNEQNDDHPPTDVAHAQKLVGDVYNGLLHGGNGLWNKTLLIVTYDEHGGFFDHIAPPTCVDDRPKKFPALGVRVPAFVVSPWVGKGISSSTVFDHTSILRTILRRFCTDANGQPASLTKRVDAANDLSGLLTEPVARTDAADAPPAPAPETVPRALAAAPPQPTDVQEGLMALRTAALKAGVPQEDL